jgi:phosphomannomutase
VDEHGRFCSTQLLMPLFIDHLARARQLPGSVIKTVSGSDLMQLVAEGLGRTVQEKPVGFKYIAAEMLAERDALFAALLLIEALVEGGVPLGQRIDALQERCGGAAAYDRLDLRLPDMATRQRLEAFLAATPPAEVAGSPVHEVITTDGVKLRLGPSHWLMLRFSGTEPLLRLYCEAPSDARVAEVLAWARQLAEAI